MTELQAQGNEADADGTVDAFVIKAVSTGSLKIGTSAVEASAWAAGSNDTVDGTHHAYWTGAQDANGVLNAFTAVAKDNSGTESSTAIQATVSVTAVNDVPTLTAYTTVVDTVNEDTQVEITLAELQAQGNEADADGTVDAFVIKAVSTGSLKIGTSAVEASAWAAGSNDTVDGTHHAYWTGAQDANGVLNAFTAVAKDNSGTESSTAIQATVSVTPVDDTPVDTNDAPVGVNDSATAIEAGGNGNGSAGTNPTGNVLSNDTDVDTGDSKTVSALSGGTVGTAKAGSYGSLTLSANGSYIYTVDNSNTNVQALKGTANTLADSFTYTVRDAGGLTGTATLTVTVQGANDVPVGVNDSAIAVEAGGTGNATAGTNPTGNVLSNNTDVDTGDSKTVSAVTGGTVGSAKTGSYGSLTLAADGSYTYTVDNANTSVQALKGTTNTLTDSFTYTVKDVGNLTGTATLTVTVQGANDAPVGVNDSATAIEAGGTGNATAGTNPIGNVLSNDTDADTGDSKTVSAVTGGTAKAGSYGSLTLKADGSYTYTVDNANTSV
ncbi:MAG: VCBS domain-containing protein, partial [Methylococcaceae bacterium]